MAFSRWEILLFLVGELLYAYYVVLRLRKGLPRLLALVLVIVPSILLPWRPPIAAERILYSFILCWSIMSKLLLLVWDMGPAGDPDAISSFPRFFSAMLFSLHLKRDVRFSPSSHLQQATTDPASGPAAAAQIDGERGSRGANSEVPNGLSHRKSPAVAESVSEKTKNGESTEVQQLEEKNIRRAKQENKHSSWPRWVEIMVDSQAGQIVVLRCVFYFVAATSLVRLVQKWKHLMPTYVLNLPLGFILYFSALFVFETAAGASAFLLGTELHPQFYLPYFSVSIGEFWGRRWNLMVNNLLRVSVYEPVLAYRMSIDEKKEKPSQLDKAIGTFASFTVSGLSHELIFFYLNKTRPTWEMTAFFMLNAVATIVEGVVKPRQRFGMPKLVGWLYTMIFVYATACWLFFPPVFRTGMVDQALVDLQTFSDWIVGLVVPQWLLR